MSIALKSAIGVAHAMPLTPIKRFINSMNGTSHIVKLLDDRICDSAANTATYHRNLFETVKLGCVSERANKIMYVFALFKP